MNTQPELTVTIHGDKEWRVDGKLHREDGPAIEASHGQFWLVNGKFHREDGPAIEYPNGLKRWYLNGKYLTEKEWENQKPQEKYFSPFTNEMI